MMLFSAIPLLGILVCLFITGIDALNVMSELNYASRRPRNERDYRHETSKLTDQNPQESHEVMQNKYLYGHANDPLATAASKS